MQVFGHAGFTLGAAAVIDHLYRHYANPLHRAPPPGLEGGLKEKPIPCPSLLKELVDLRILLAGSLLPDAIDKPLGIYILGGAIGNGRIFSHTLLFLLVFTTIGVLVYRRWRHTWPLVLAFGTLTHLVFDSMWNRPQTLFWPLLGTVFPKQDSGNWIQNNIHNLLTRPSFYVPEIAGFIILLVFLVIVWKRKSLGILIKRGKA